MAYDTHSLLAYSLVVGGGVIGSTTGTTLQVTATDSSKFAINQNVTVWPSGVEPNLGTAGIARNAEIMRITSIDTQSDTLTVTRAQEGLTPALSTIAAGYQVANTITPKVLTDIENLLYLPYKFSVYRNNAWNTANNVPTAVPFDTAEYDTGSNVDIVTNKGRFTAPVAGWYGFSTAVLVSGSATRIVIEYAKNGAEYKRVWDTGTVTGAAGNLGGSVDVQLAANDFFEVWEYTPAAFTGGFGTAPIVTWFSGHLICRT